MADDRDKFSQLSFDMNSHLSIHPSVMESMVGTTVNTGENPDSILFSDPEEDLEEERGVDDGDDTDDDSNDGLIPERGFKKKKRFPYKNRHDILLLSCIRQTDAHIAERGTKIKKFDLVRDQYYESLSTRDKANYNLPSNQSLRDRFSLLVKKRSRVVLEQAEKSGIEYAITKEMDLLDDLILEKEEFDEMETHKKQEKENKQLILTRKRCVVKRQQEQKNWNLKNAD